MACNNKAHTNDKVIANAIQSYKEHLEKGDITADSAINLLKYRISAAKSLFAAKQLLSVADELAEKRNYIAAYRCFRLSADLAPDHESARLTIGYDKLRMAELEAQVGDYHTAQQSSVDALAYFKEEDVVYRVEAYNTIAMTFEYLKEYDLAFQNYYKASQFPNSVLNHLILQNNLAHIYTLQKHRHLALQLYRRLLAHDTLRNSAVDYARTADNYGYALFLHNPNEGEARLLEAVALREKHQLLSDLPSSYLHLSEFYSEKDKAKALKFADKAYQAASLAGNPDEKLDALAANININKDAKNGSVPIQYIILNESLNQSRSAAKNTFAKLRFDRTEIELQNTERERQLLIVTLILFTVAAGSAFYWYKVKKDRQLDEQRTTARFAKKLHDEVANDMFQALSFAEHEDLSKDHIREILLDNLEDIYSKTRDISKDNSHVDTGENFPAELRGLINAFVGVHTKIVIAGVEQLDWNKASVATKITCYRIVQEWLVNMKKHSDASLVAFNFKKTGKFLSVSYTDNGKGSDKKTGNGLQNAENRTKQLKGTLNFETVPGKGFRATLQIPF